MVTVREGPARTRPKERHAQEQEQPQRQEEHQGYDGETSGGHGRHERGSDGGWSRHRISGVIDQHGAYVPREHGPHDTRSYGWRGPRELVITLVWAMSLTVHKPMAR